MRATAATTATPVFLVHIVIVGLLALRLQGRVNVTGNRSNPH